MEKLGNSVRVKTVIKSVYDGYSCQVLHDGKFPEPYPVNSGVRQKCILSPMLFVLVLDDIVIEVLAGSKRRIILRMMELLEDLDYAEDIFLLANRYSDMQEKITRLDQVSERAGLKIIILKTKEMHVNPKIFHPSLGPGSKQKM
jgi:hypothetical protein